MEEEKYEQPSARAPPKEVMSGGLVGGGIGIAIIVPLAAAAYLLLFSNDHKPKRPIRQPSINRQQPSINERLNQIEEAIRKRLSQIESVLEQYDTNQNGDLDKEEYERYKEDAIHVEKILDLYEVWHDGYLNETELYRLLKDTNRQGILVKQVLKKYDRDQDGVLDRTELPDLLKDYHPSKE